MSNARGKGVSGTCASEEMLLEGRKFPADVHKKLKALLQEGNVEAFRREAGEAYIISGYVVEGNKIGRTLGYPTANLGYADASQVQPGQGVYIAMVKVEGRWFEGMANIGIRPTIDADNVTIEAHLFDFSKDIYGKKISIALLSRIRDEMRFNSLSELKVQLDRDALTAKELLRNIRWS